jgi:hypothetical protein
MQDNGYDPEPTPGQMEEFERRAERLSRNPESGIPWEQIRADLKKKDRDLTPAQAAELDRRLADFKVNPHEGIPWEQVEAELNERFGRK